MAQERPTRTGDTDIVKPTIFPRIETAYPYAPEPEVPQPTGLEGMPSFDSIRIMAATEKLKGKLQLKLDNQASLVT